MRWTMFALVLLLHQGAAAAAERIQIVLPFHDVALIPGHVVRLKAETMRIHPDFDFSSVDLDSVDIVAKSRMGQGHIALRVGNQYSERKPIPGRKPDYDDPAAASFHSVSIRHHGASSNGLWQLLVVGYIKIRRVVLHMRPRNEDVLSRRAVTFAAAPARVPQDTGSNMTR